MNYINNIKRIIYHNPSLFQLYYHLYRKNRGVRINYFNKNIKFLMDGYPRSGNTFAARLVKNIFGKDVFVHHFHAVAPIKIALRRNIPVFVLIREPEESITSNYLKEFSLKKKPIPKKINIILLRELTIRYKDFYKYVQQNKNNLEIIGFQNLVNNPKHVINRINQLIYQNKFKITSSEIEGATNSNKGATDTYGSSKPNREKEQLKSKLKIELFKLREYKEADNLYRSLSN